MTIITFIGRFNMEIRVKSDNKSNRISKFTKNPMRVIVVSFVVVVLVGTILLMLPITARNGQGLSFLESLFTATSATCVTGLIVVDTYTHFNMIGQTIILILIQLGGLGLVTITAFFHIAIRRKLGLKSVNIVKESINTESLPDIPNLLKMIMKLTISIEVLGALLLSFVIIPDFGLYGIFISIFLSISAFCNAGFDVLGIVEPYVGASYYSQNPYVLIVLMLLIISGGLGFIVWYDLVHYNTTKKIMLHTKIVIFSTIGLIVTGTILIAMLEWNNKSTIGDMSTTNKIINSAFLSVSCRTAGFNTFNLNNMDGITKMICIFLMFIGSAPGSTGGGIKITTAVVLFMTVMCVLRGKDETVFFSKRASKNVVYKSLTIMLVASFAVIVSTCAIIWTIHGNGLDVPAINALFESVSAFSTVGLSVGVTSVVNNICRILLIIAMFMGRVGPVSLGLSLAMKIKQNKNKVIPEAKIMVG